MHSACSWSLFFLGDMASGFCYVCGRMEGPAALAFLPKVRVRGRWPWLRTVVAMDSAVRVCRRERFGAALGWVWRQGEVR